MNKRIGVCAPSMGHDTEESICHINSLPVEIIVQIFSHVNESSLLAVRLSCQLWRSICDNYFFKLNAVLTDETFKYFENNYAHKSHIQLETLQVQNLKRTFPASSFSRSSLSLNPKILIFRENSKCSFCPSITEKNVTHILMHNRNVSSLDFEKSSLRGIKSRSLHLGILLQNLHELYISLIIGSCRLDDPELFTALSKLKTPNLSLLRLSLTTLLDCAESAALCAYFGMYELVATRRSPLLKVLEIESVTEQTRQLFEGQHGYNRMRHSMISPTNNSTRRMDQSNNRNRGNVRQTRSFTLAAAQRRKTELSLLSQEKKLESMQEDLEKVQLNTFKVEFSPGEGFKQRTLGFHLLSCQSQLTNLEINSRGSVGGTPNEIHHSYFHQLAEAVKRNKETLQVISVQYGKVLQPQDFIILSKAITLCIRLEELKLVIFTNPTFPHPLPPSITRIHMIGSLDPHLLEGIKNGLRSLQNLTFLNVDCEFVPRNHEYVTSLKSILILPSLRKVVFCSPAMKYDFVREIMTGRLSPIKMEVVRVPNNNVAYIEIPS